MNSIAQREHTIKHPEIQDRIKAVHRDTNRGKYVKKKRVRNVLLMIFNIEIVHKHYKYDAV